MKEARSIKPFGLRVPEELMAWFKHKAIDNRRSVNAELLIRLEESKRQEESKHAQTA